MQALDWMSWKVLKIKLLFYAEFLVEILSAYYEVPLMWLSYYTVLR